MLGHELLPSWIVRILRNTTSYEQMTAKDVLAEQQALVRQADLMVVECQTPSFGIGFLMHLALQERVPILCLYPEESDTTGMSDMIAGNSSSLVFLRAYRPDNLEQVVADFCASQSSDDLHKFNFIASREVLDYIEDGARTASKSKSEFLRDELAELIRSKRSGH